MKLQALDHQILFLEGVNKCYQTIGSHLFQLSIFRIELLSENSYFVRNQQFSENQGFNFCTITFTS